MFCSKTFLKGSAKFCQLKLSLHPIHVVLKKRSRSTKVRFCTSLPNVQARKKWDAEICRFELCIQLENNIRHSVMQVSLT